MQSFLKIFGVYHQFTELGNSLKEFGVFFYGYSRRHVLKSMLFFEDQKNILVKLFTMKRGRYSRPFLHMATIGVLGIGVMITPVLADTYPIFSSNAQAIDKVPSSQTEKQSITVDNNVFQTDISQKPRDTIITYTVAKGDTLSSIAQKFGVSVDTIKWQNNLTSDDVNVGDSLDILPVTGVSYKVESGDTVYSIAKKFNTNPQKIVDFPFNTFANPETFSLVVGEILIVPDGVPAPQQTLPQYVAIQAPSVPEQSTQTPSGSGFIWPIHGEITQFYSWYHSGLDIAGPIGTPIYAAKGGTVMEASCGWNWGYGCHVLLNNGSGFSTMYAHMVTLPSVSVGQSVGQGQLLGFRGSTGNSTGPHTHFEIRINGHAVNPYPYLQ